MKHPAIASVTAVEPTVNSSLDLPERTRAWRNRIIEHAEVDPLTLKANPKNWRLHPKSQQAALAGVLREVGWVQDVIVNKRTGFVVDGHARIDLAIAAGEKVPVKYVDLTEKEEALILASLDPITSMAMADEAALAPLLAQVNTESAELDVLLKSMLDEATVSQLKDVGGEGADGETVPPIYDGPRSGAVKAVFAVEDLRIVEQALLLANQRREDPNIRGRGLALLLICKEFIEAHVETTAAGQ